ncbi:MAG: hypothetical protein AABX11_07855 [Nanoarchaeota archaeon]
MKIRPYVNRLNDSKEYKDFCKKHADAFLIAGFFILDLETKKNIHQIDYYVPKEKKVAAFTLDGGVNVQLLSMVNNKVPEVLDINTNIDLDALYGILEDEMKNRNITENIQKIIAVLQNIDGKKMWNLNCVLSGMGILRAHIDDDSKTILKMEKASILDYIKKVNPADLQKTLAASQGIQQSNETLNPPQASQKGKLTKAQINTELDKLNKLEEAIEAEKKKLQGTNTPSDSKTSASTNSKANPSVQKQASQKKK